MEILVILYFLYCSSHVTSYFRLWTYYIPTELVGSLDVTLCRRFYGLRLGSRLGSDVVGLGSSGFYTRCYSVTIEFGDSRPTKQCVVSIGYGWRVFETFFTK